MDTAARLADEPLFPEGSCHEPDPLVGDLWCFCGSPVEDCPVIGRAIAAVREAERPS